MADVLIREDLLRSDLPKGHPLSPDLWLLPSKIEIGSGDRLVWFAGIGAPHFKPVNPPDNLLGQFVKLREADGQQILEFARTYGVLTLCEQHGLPSCHNKGCSFRVAKRRRKRGGPLVMWERLDEWRQLAARANAVVELTTCADDDKEVSVKLNTRRTELPALISVV